MAVKKGSVRRRTRALPLFSTFLLLCHTQREVELHSTAGLSQTPRRVARSGGRHALQQCADSIIRARPLLHTLYPASALQAVPHSHSRHASRHLVHPLGVKTLRLPTPAGSARAG